MTHPAGETNPLRAGAPLPPGVDIEAGVFNADIGDELARAEVELLYALARHRKAWQAMRRRAEEREALGSTVGALAAIEADPIWKKRTGDVSWWRDEVTCQATAVLALRGMLADRGVHTDPSGMVE